MSHFDTPESNPYAPPRALPPVAFQPQFTADPMFGVWRQGNVLVMLKNAALPDRCVKSNEPAEGRTLKRVLRWHHPLAYLALLANLLIYLIVAVILTKSATIHIGLCQRWIGIRRRRMVVAWLIVLAGLAMIGVGITQVDNQDGTAAVLIFGGIVGIFGAAIYGLFAARMVAPTRITDTHVWLKGVHPDYLALIPEWPFGN